MSAPLLINGRFLSRPLTGVERCACELTRALYKICPERVTIALPADAGPPPVAVPATHPGRRRGYLWEQVDLARHTPEACLLSLCNLGPVLRAAQAVMMHDAQVFDLPQNFSPRFRRAYQLIQPRLARRAHHVFTVSHYSRARLEARGVVPRGKAKVIANGADHLDMVRAEPGILDRHGLEPRGFFLTVGSQSPHKNLSCLIDAATMRLVGSAPLVVVGGASKHIFSTTQMPRPLASAPLMLGRVSDPELKTLYRNALAFALPSRAEGFGLPALEAMREGCPVLAANAGALPETCGPAARLLDPDRAEDWCTAMQAIEASATMRQELAQRGEEHAARFTWLRAASQLLEALC